jgi:branched-chain amino acid aminotransferase
VAATPHDPTILIVAQPATAYPPEVIQRGARVVVAGLHVNPLDPFSGHKTLNYWPRLRELQTAGAKRADEAVVLQITNHLAGGCVSNIFLVKNGELLAPIARGEEQEVAEEGDRAAAAQGAAAAKGAVLPSPVLPGVTRRFVLDWAQKNSLEVRRRMLTIDDLLAADEVFLTNSSWGVLPVVRVEEEPIGEGAVGEVSRNVRAAWLAATEDVL